MSRPETTASFAFSLGLVAALLALCLRLMVPVGWMPIATPGGVTFTLCAVGAEHQTFVGKDAKPIAPDSGDKHGGPCAFSGMGTPALADVPPGVALQIFFVFLALGFAASPRPRLAAINWLRPPLRGPPTLA